MNTNEVVIEFEGVSKKFNKGKKLLLKEALVDMFRPERQEPFWAVKDVSFKINKGESVGIIGSNGSGKSTILKLIAGVTVPTKGKVMVNGRISPLIELGAGFHPELTGRENIYLNGTILGLSKKEIDERYDKIIEFSELNDFVDTPVKHYSSGMYMRLGFSVAVFTSPDILLVDEILAVGDAPFQEKCLKKMKEFKDNGVTIIFISHDTNAIERFCDRSILMKNGNLIFEGDTKKAVQLYTKDFEK